MTENYIIDYKDVSIFNNNKKILENINFRLSAGEFVFLIGKVGCGKTSLLKTMYAELPIYQGSADVIKFAINKIKQKNIPSLRRQIGIIFQDFNLLMDRNVYDNLKFVLEVTNWKNKNEIDQRINEVLEQMKISDKKNSMPYQLSGGEQQRVVIARAILNNPKLIIADEPTGNLDTEAAKEIANLLYKCSQQGSTVIFATHNYSLLNNFKSRVLEIKNGKLN